MSRFAVLEHDTGGGVHYDLMLERGGTLLTWSFEAFPAAGFGCKSLFDHPLRFLDYEGPLHSAPGSVRRTDDGTCDLVRVCDDCWRVTFRGGRLAGDYRLVRSQDDAWQLVTMI